MVARDVWDVLVRVRISAARPFDKLKALGLWISLFDYTPPGVYTNAMDTKGKIIRRLKIIEGQVRGLQQLVENKAYCIDIITQTSAVKQGLSNFEDLLLEKHLGHCVVGQIKRGETNKATKEILKVYQLKRK